MKNKLFLLIGEDKKLIDFNLFDILSKIEYDDNNKIIYDMNSSSFMDVLEEASMVSLFSSVKVIVVNNFMVDDISEDEFDYLEKYLNGENDDVYIILIANKVDSRKKNFKIFKENFKIIEVDKMDNSYIFDYVSKNIIDNGFRIDNINLDYLLSKLGNDINNINNELNKLFIYKDSGKNITREDIDLLIFDNIENVIYEFTNAILDNDYEKIKKMYNNFMIDNVGIDYLISALANSFRVSFIIKLLNNRNMSNFDIAKFIGKKEFFVKKSLDRLYRYTLDELGNYINKLAIIDRELKNGRDNVGKFELFLFSRDS